ncbi:SLATT domain-containing protein [Stenotrophomonas maltophilia]|uniref:SLATT domain-containing protein n=1 Tax=Stenotrophomonas maltophilia TaxID=40324 RepID=A0ABD7BZY5_STEMA|nr:SLATT domain-containing protein [Stenotrophomonas maltophilia]QQQ40978.1 SLATT domain-containing protein [Stenotrophomonas maltophilia]
MNIFDGLKREFHKRDRGGRMSAEKLKKLYKKMDATSKTRFHYSRRMKLHSSLSTWIVVYISLVLILISLLQAYSLGRNIESPYVQLIQVFSSIAVLVYSLIINKADYSSLSEKMYSCASRINKLKLKADPAVAAGDMAAYESLCAEYQGILDLYETASIQDFRADYWRAKMEMPEDYILDKGQVWSMRFKISFLYAVNFIEYPLVVFSYALAIYWLVVGGV